MGIESHSLSAGRVGRLGLRVHSTRIPGRVRVGLAGAGSDGGPGLAGRYRHGTPSLRPCQGNRAGWAARAAYHSTRPGRQRQSWRLGCSGRRARAHPSGWFRREFRASESSRRWRRRLATFPDSDDSGQRLSTVPCGGSPPLQPAQRRHHRCVWKRPRPPKQRRPSKARRQLELRSAAAG